MAFQFVSQTLHNVEKLSRETMLKIWNANLVSKIRIGLTTCDGRKCKIVCYKNNCVIRGCLLHSDIFSIFALNLNAEFIYL